MTQRFNALTVRESNGKSYFTKIGVMFPNRTGNGFTLMLDAVPASVDGQYRILLREPQERDGGSRGNNGGSNVPPPFDDEVPY